MMNRLIKLKNRLMRLMTGFSKIKAVRFQLKVLILIFNIMKKWFKMRYVIFKIKMLICKKMNW